MKPNAHDTALIKTGTTKGYATPGSAAEYRHKQTRRLITTFIVCFIVIVISAVIATLPLPSHPTIFVCALVGTFALFGAYIAFCNYMGPPGDDTLRIRSELALHLTPQVRNKLFQARQEEDPEVLRALIRHFEDRALEEDKKYVNDRVQDILGN